MVKMMIEFCDETAAAVRATAKAKGVSASAWMREIVENVTHTGERFGMERVELPEWTQTPDKFFAKKGFDASVEFPVAVLVSKADLQADRKSVV